MWMQNHQNRRRKYFIDPSFQGKLIALVVAMIFLVAAAGLVPMILTTGQPGEITPESQQISYDFTNIMMLLLVVVVFAVVTTVFYGVRLSHRIVGPIYAFSRQLNWIRDGIYTRDLRLREKDEFKNLAQSFNNMQSAICRRSKQTIDLCAKAEENLEELKKLLGQPDMDIERARNMIEGLKQDFAGLRNMNEKFISES
jgi:methyl-accepting chemotaxis protein